MTYQTTTTHIESLIIDNTPFGKIWLTQDNDRIVLTKEEVRELMNNLTTEKTSLDCFWLMQGSNTIVLSKKEARELIAYLKEV